MIAWPAVDVSHLSRLGGGGAGPRYWVVDPLDGTTNFVHGFWAVGVSVALVEEGRPVAAAVHAPFLGSMWIGGRGLGAWGEDGSRLPGSGSAAERGGGGGG